MSPPTRAPLPGRGSGAETRRIADILRKETVGGAVLLVVAAVALVWAHWPWGGAYEALRGTCGGPPVRSSDRCAGKSGRQVLR